MQNGDKDLRGPSLSQPVTAQMASMVFRRVAEDQKIEVRTWNPFVPHPGLSPRPTAVRIG